MLELHVTEPATPGTEATDPVKVPVAWLSTRPPIIRIHSPPPTWSGWALGSPATKAFPCATKAVFTVPITDVIALDAPATPPIIGPKNGPYGAGSVLVQPDCACAEAVEGTNAKAMTEPNSTTPKGDFRARRASVGWLDFTDARTAALLRL